MTSEADLPVSPRDPASATTVPDVPEVSQP